MQNINNNPEILPYHISEQINSKTYTIYLNEEIVEPEKYSKIFSLLRSVGEYDVVHIHINSPGGNLFTGVQLITCIKQCFARVITSLDGMAFSLAPLILFAGDEINISENSIIMFHHYTSGGTFKGNEEFAKANAMNTFYKDTLMKYGKPFLTDDEVDQIIDGKDLYFGDDIINERIELIMDTDEFKDDGITKIDDIELSAKSDFDKE